VKWVARAPGKVNLCLFVGVPRADGYHPLVSVVQPVSLADDLTLESGDEWAATDEVVCPGVVGPNLAERALRAFRERAGWNGPGMRLRIAKHVPVAAGMGGGSGDAAAALRLAAAATGRAEDASGLADVAARLGADVPAQLVPQRCLMSGIGERVEALPQPGDFGLLILPSADRLSTPAVYAEFDRLGLGRSADELDRLSGAVRGAAAADSLGDERLLVNDLEPAARSLLPEIDEALEEARRTGADHAMVSGSGPTVFGLFLGPDGPERAHHAAAALGGRDPAPVAATPVGPGFAAPRAVR
jgi:4-diphosphocytidyl-2-C-methyl-D-erythritol kinase